MPDCGRPGDSATNRVRARRSRRSWRTPSGTWMVNGRVFIRVTLATIPDIESSLLRRFPQSPLVVAGEIAGGNMAAVCAIRSRDRGGPALALQVLVWDQYLPDVAQHDDPEASPLRQRDPVRRSTCHRRDGRVPSTSGRGHGIRRADAAGRHFGHQPAIRRHAAPVLSAGQPVQPG